ncbi:hypothetical protein [Acutalibacter caecimuris]|uniref:hypothetical protein n=1 Tax=Acutalibacter caecimuris TaxID=3093657 RepID=UPI002AC98E83|nr:hypothetical protein [Acutalibacter sp. M00118]
MGKTFAEMQNMYRDIVRRFREIEGKPWQAQGAMIELTKQVGELAKQVMLKENDYAWAGEEAEVDRRLGIEMAGVIA